MSLGITLSGGRLIPMSELNGRICALELRQDSHSHAARMVLLDNARRAKADLEAVQKDMLNLIDALHEGGYDEAIREKALSAEDGRKFQDIHEALEAMADMGDPDSLRVVSIIHRLLADDWSQSGVYEACEDALTKAEEANTRTV